MFGMKTYSRDYIGACRARVGEDLRAYRKQVGEAPSKEFEARFFNGQVFLLDNMFVHRLPGIEGKDCNPLNEARVLCNSLLLNQASCRSTGSRVGRTQPSAASSSRRRSPC